MELRVITLDNGMKLVGRADKPAPTPEQSAFAAELERVAKAARQAEASGSTKVQAAWSSLTPSSREVLERMKAEEPSITEEEWDRLKRELSAMGLISGTDLANTTNNVVVLGKMELFEDFLVPQGMAGQPGAFLTPQGSSSKNFEIEWTGNPLKYMDMWIQALRRDINGAPDRAEQVESYEKLHRVLSELLETAGGF